MQIACRLAKCLVDLSCAMRGEIDMQNGYICVFSINTIELKQGDQTMFRAPISEIADLETERWG